MNKNYIYSNLFWFILVEKKTLEEIEHDIFSGAFSKREVRKHIMVLHQLESFYLKWIIQEDWKVDDKSWRWLSTKWRLFKKRNENMKYPSMELVFDHKEEMELSK